MQKIYNVPQAARLIGVHERTVRYWIRKKRVKPKLDYRNYPVFTSGDITKIKKWRSTLKEAR
jgi:DNA-binding transcriptional MerR regulator